MARARNIKPGLYKNEDLAECSIWARFVYPGLWMLADREGRLEDRPKRIKAELLPFDAQDMEPLLAELAAGGFIVRYQNEDGNFIQITSFSKHQTPHYSEKQSVIKAPKLQESVTHIQSQNSESPPKNSRKQPLIKRGSQPPDSLIHRFSDSPNPDLPTADSPNPPSKPLAPEPCSDRPTVAVWQAYTEAYRRRYQVDPTPNATVYGQLAHFVKRVPQSDAPAIAAFYVTHNARRYLEKKHPVGLMLHDAEGLRTEWLSGRTVTETKAREGDRLQTQGEVWKTLLKEAGSEPQSH